MIFIIYVGKKLIDINKNVGDTDIF